MPRFYPVWAAQVYKKSAKTMGAEPSRVIYTIEIKECVFVLHAFQKKSKSGIATPKQELDLLNARLKEAKALYKSMNV